MTLGLELPMQIFDELIEKKDFKLLKYLDPYGDVIFNKLQAGDLISDLLILKNNTQAKEDIDLIDKIIEMATRCKNESHLYLGFYGD